MLQSEVRPHCFPAQRPPSASTPLSSNPEVLTRVLQCLPSLFSRLSLAHPCAATLVGCCFQNTSNELRPLGLYPWPLPGCPSRDFVQVLPPLGDILNLPVQALTPYLLSLILLHLHNMDLYLLFIVFILIIIAIIDRMCTSCWILSRPPGNDSPSPAPLRRTLGTSFNSSLT